MGIVCLGSPLAVFCVTFGDVLVGWSSSLEILVLVLPFISIGVRSASGTLLPSLTVFVPVVIPLSVLISFGASVVLVLIFFTSSASFIVFSLSSPALLLISWVSSLISYLFASLIESIILVASIPHIWVVAK